jgi:hypothetical protein
MQVIAKPNRPVEMLYHQRRQVVLPWLLPAAVPIKAEPSMRVPMRATAKQKPQVPAKVDHNNQLLLRLSHNQQKLRSPLTKHSRAERSPPAEAALKAAAAVKDSVVPVPWALLDLPAHQDQTETMVKMGSPAETVKRVLTLLKTASSQPNHASNALLHLQDQLAIPDPKDLPETPDNRESPLSLEYRGHKAHLDHRVLLDNRAHRASPVKQDRPDRLATFPVAQDLLGHLDLPGLRDQQDKPVVWDRASLVL